jgi:hypothetical protein
MDLGHKIQSDVGHHVHIARERDVLPRENRGGRIKDRAGQREQEARRPAARAVWRPCRRCPAECQDDHSGDACRPQPMLSPPHVTERSRQGSFPRPAFRCRPAVLQVDWDSIRLLAARRRSETKPKSCRSFQRRFHSGTPSSVMAGINRLRRLGQTPIKTCSTQVRYETALKRF